MSGSTGRCARCDGVLEAEDRFCGECGTPRPVAVVAPAVPKTPAPTAAPQAAGLPEPRPSRRRLRTLVLVALAMTALAAGVLFLRPSTPRDVDLRNTLALTNVANRTGRFYSDGKPEYAWVAYLYLEGPPSWQERVLRQVSFVRYELHPSFKPNVIDVRDRPLDGFPLSTSGWGTFPLKAEVHFRDGTTRVLVHQLRF